MDFNIYVYKAFETEISTFSYAVLEDNFGKPAGPVMHQVFPIQLSC